MTPAPALGGGHGCAILSAMSNAPVRLMATLGLLVALASPAFADQTDERLPELFERLQTAPTAFASTIVEQRIWAIWLETDDDGIAALMATGTSALALGRLEEALAEFDALIDLAPDYAEGWNKRATVHYMLGNYEESLADIEATLALEPRHFGALSGRGLVYIRLRELEKALSAFEETLQVGPAMENVRANIDALREALGVRDI